VPVGLPSGANPLQVVINGVLANQVTLWVK
jgi:hypothetical protein